MKKYNVKILESFFVTHDVKSFIVERPENYTFEPGQATEVSINKNGWKEEKRPFTFTSLPEENFFYNSLLNPTLSTKVLLKKFTPWM